MSDSISSDEVKHVAHLARLRLTSEELVTFTDQLRAVLDHAKDVEALELDDVEPMSSSSSASTSIENTMRKDIPNPMLNPSDSLPQAPAVEGGRFLVPKILGEEE